MVVMVEADDTFNTRSAACDGAGVRPHASVAKAAAKDARAWILNISLSPKVDYVTRDGLH